MAKAKKGAMRRVAEGVYQRDGRYLVKWWEPDGKGGGTRRQETLPEGTTLAEAKTFKGDKEREKKKPKSRRIRCEDAAARWMDEWPRPSSSTNKQNAERVSKFGKDFEGRFMDEIDVAEARLWFHQNPSRIKSVRAMFNDYMAAGYVPTNPFDGLRPRERPRGRLDITIATEAEVDRMVEIARDMHGEYGAVIGGLIGAAAWTGARPGELYALEWPDVDLNNARLHITSAVSSVTGETGTPKWNSQRVIALLPQAVEVFRAIPRHPFSETVFWTQRGKQFNARTFHYYFVRVRAAFWNELPKSRKAHDKAEAERERKIAPDFDLYELRHHYASYLANTLHATGREIAKQLGHKDGGRLAERLYIHTEDEDANASILERARMLAEERERRAAAR